MSAPQQLADTAPWSPVTAPIVEPKLMKPSDGNASWYLATRQNGEQRNIKKTATKPTQLWQHGKKWQSGPNLKLGICRRFPYLKLKTQNKMQQYRCCPYVLRATNKFYLKNWLPQRIPSKKSVGVLGTTLFEYKRDLKATLWISLPQNLNDTNNKNYKNQITIEEAVKPKLWSPLTTMLVNLNKSNYTVHDHADGLDLEVGNIWWCRLPPGVTDTAWVFSSDAFIYYQNLKREVEDAMKAREEADILESIRFLFETDKK